MVKVQRLRQPNSSAPLVTWVPVTGADGRVRMEMRWHVGESTPTHHTPRSVA